MDSLHYMQSIRNTGYGYFSSLEDKEKERDEKYKLTRNTFEEVILDKIDMQRLITKIKKTMTPRQLKICYLIENGMSKRSNKLDEIIPNKKKDIKIKKKSTIKSKKKPIVKSKKKTIVKKEIKQLPLSGKKINKKKYNERRG